MSENKAAIKSAATCFAYLEKIFTMPIFNSTFNFKDKTTRCDSLSGNFKIFQPQSGQRYTTDDLLTAWMAILQNQERRALRFFDLGSGLCSVPMIVLWKFPQISGAGVELQPDRFQLGQKSLEFNGLTSRFHLSMGDLREVNLGEKFDLITSTPPYHQKIEGLLSPNDDKAAARFELNGTIEDYFDSAKRHLSKSGLFVTLYPFARIQKVYDASNKAGLFVNSRVDFVPRAGKKPLISIFSISYTDLPEQVATLTMRDTSGKHTKEYNDVRTVCGFKPKME